MNDEMIVVLEHSYMGEDILNYIRTLEREYYALRKENEKLNRALDKACEFLGSYSGSCPCDTLNVDLDCEEKCENQYKDCWKEWCLYEDNSK